ncbi:MAG: hypothetical protein BM557_07770 [Flavobacterium sp. MedPE-SWcel]|uniref:DUF5777 family beta-barrel protein n=1 Tax=uncultured Flavobacterium sp. TaxID=165435 RepID=UPI000921FE68|nr:DUF5777 family beta-barrel protein [uncultured Flavobacterium sp.]OIQ18105.1 MAG: hypothetical protein BM557_07770 [Flavobacterium sp. MedPE-SWcel]
MKKYIVLIICILFNVITVFAQDDLLNELETEVKDESFEQPAFKAMKIGNLQSTKVAGKKDLYMYVSHRFGSLNDGLTTFFGFDNANTKIQLVYGIIDGIQIGGARESLKKTYSTHIKASIKKQSTNFPINIVGYATANIRTDLREEQFPLLKFGDRMSYATQLLVSRRFNNHFSFELAPTFVRQNLVLEPFQKHNQFAMGIGGRLKVSKRMSVNADYIYNFSRHESSIYNNPLTVGVDIETGGHVFQLLFSNAQSTNEPGFISNAEGEWFKNIFFGFNIVRVF